MRGKLSILEQTGKKIYCSAKCIRVLEDVTGNARVCQKIRGSISLAIIPLNGEE